MNKRFGILIQSLVAAVIFISCGSSRSVSRENERETVDSTRTRTEILAEKNMSLAELIKTNGRIKLHIRRYDRGDSCSAPENQLAAMITEDIEADIDFAKEESRSGESDEEQHVKSSNDSFSKSEAREQEDKKTDVAIENPIQDIAMNLFFILVLLITIRIFIKKLNL